MNIEMLDSPVCEITEYQPFLAELTTIEEENSKLVFDYESKAGNKEARSHIHKLRQSKGTLERLRKEAKAESLRMGKLIDSEAGAIEGRINKMIGVHQMVIDGIEKREADRVAAIQRRLDLLRTCNLVLQSEEFYRINIAATEAVLIDESWQEFRAEAALAKDDLLTNYRNSLAQRIKADADAAELEQLRAAEAQRRAAEPVVQAPEPKGLFTEMIAAQGPEFVEAMARIDVVARPAAPIPSTPMRQPSDKAVVNRKALDALVANGIPEEQARACVTLIAKGLVPGVQIFY